MFHEAILCPKSLQREASKVGFGQTVPTGMSANFNATLGKKGMPQKWIYVGMWWVTTLTRGVVARSLYMDNFFSSVHLFRRLLEDNIYATGTLHSKQKMFPPDLVLASRGALEFCQADNVVVTVWKDTRPVVLSTHDPSNVGTVSRKQKDGR